MVNTFSFPRLLSTKSPSTTPLILQLVLGASRPLVHQKSIQISESPKCTPNGLLRPPQEDESQQS